MIVTILLYFIIRIAILSKFAMSIAIILYFAILIAILHINTILIAILEKIPIPKYCNTLTMLLKYNTIGPTLIDRGS